MSIHRPIDGLLGRPDARARRRRRRALVGALLAGVFVTVWLQHADDRASGCQAQGRGESAYPTDRLLTLQVPRLTPEPGPDAVDGQEGDFDSSLIEGRIERNQSMFVALRGHGIAPADIQPVVAAVGQIFDFRRAQVGHRYEATLDEHRRILRFRYQTAPEIIYEAVRREDGGYDAEQVRVALETRRVQLTGVVEGSLSESIVRAGAGAGLANHFAQVFRWDIDFSRDSRLGDTFGVIYEATYLDGEFLRYGRLLAAEYRGARAAMRAYHFDEPGAEGYFDDEGRPLERLFLAAPLRYVRISSRFDPNRMHPVLRRRRPHLGVDYAAPTGTPVWSAANGTVSFAGYRGAYGNLVVIRHAQGYETAYAHLHRIDRGIRPGVRVRQGQSIGTVGTTGLSTGPHLHFELRQNGRHLDPLGHRQARQQPLRGRELAAFQRHRQLLVTELDALPWPTPSDALLAAAEAADREEAERAAQDDDMHGDEE